MMVSDSGSKPGDGNLFHRRVLKSYHKRQQIQLMKKNLKSTPQQVLGNDNSSSSSNNEVEDSKCNFVPKKRFCIREPVQGSGFRVTDEKEMRVVLLELRYGIISMIGRRRVMEDALKVDFKVGDEYVFFGAYDGHGGARVSHACRDRLHYLVENELMLLEGEEKKDWEKVMMTCFKKMDDEVMMGESNSGGVVNSSEEGYNEELGRTVGSTAVVVMVGEEEIVVANCGDGRAVLCSHGVAIPLSNDHKPDRPDEKKRVEDAGGKILNWNGSRVQGVLATSRSIGDHYLKPFVIPEPEVTVYKRNERDEFLVIATDGLWDVVSNETTCEVVRKCLDGKFGRRLPERDGTAEAAALLAELAIAKGSKDNISVIVVELDKIK